MKIQRKWKRCSAGHLLEVLMARIFAKKAGCLYLQGFSASGNKKTVPASYLRPACGSSGEIRP